MALNKDLFNDLEQQVGNTNTETPHALAQLILPFDGNKTNSFNSKNRFDYDRGEIWLTEMPYKGDETQIALCIGKSDSPNQTDAVEYAKDLIRVPLERIVAYFENFNSVTIDGVEYGDPAEVFQKMMEKFELISYNGDGKSITVTNQSIISLKVDGSLNNLIKVSENGVLVEKPQLIIESSNSVDIDEASTYTVKIKSGDDVTTQTFSITADNVKIGDISVKERLAQLKNEIDANKLTIDENINKGVQLNEKNGVITANLALADTKSGLLIDEQGKLKVSIDAHDFNVGSLDRESNLSFNLHEALIINKEDLVRGSDGIELSQHIKDRLDEIYTKQDRFSTDENLQLVNGKLSITKHLEDQLQHLSDTPGQIIITNDRIGLDPVITTKLSTLESLINLKTGKDEFEQLRTIVSLKPERSDLSALDSQITERLSNYVKESSFSVYSTNSENKIDRINEKLTEKADALKLDNLTENFNALKTELSTMEIRLDGDTLILKHGSQTNSLDLSRFVAKGLIKEANFVGDQIVLTFDDGKTLFVPIGDLLSNVQNEIADVKSKMELVKNSMSALETTIKKDVADNTTLLTGKMNNLEVKMNTNDLEYDDDNDQLELTINGLKYAADLPIIRLEQVPNDHSIEITQDSGDKNLRRIQVQIASGPNALTCDQNGLYVQPAGSQKITLMDGTQNTLENILNSMNQAIKDINDRLSKTPIYTFSAPMTEKEDRNGNVTVSLNLDNQSLIVENNQLTVGTVDANLQ